MLSPDTILQGRYRIIRQLGQGGMGAVYEAVDQRLDTTVALKETLFTDERLRKQFEREARLLARLHHQALPRVSDHFNEGAGQFLVMQYIAGDDLSSMLAHRNGPFPQEDVLRWADQLCDTLDYLHTQDPEIIHRDIKPQNLKLTERGQMVLLDFGLAKGSAGQMSVVTTSASIFGYTPNYAPLEQVQGLGTDPRSDIYALAATLYHLLTNVKPPDALSRAGALVNGQPDPLLAANQVAPQISGAVANVLSKGMSQKRDDRFASALLMREAFRVASASGPELENAGTVLASGAAAGSGARTIVSDKSTKLMGEQTQAAGSEAETLIAADATEVRGVPARGETVTAVRATSDTKASRMWLVAALLLIVVAGGAAGFFVYRARRNQAQNPTPVSTGPAHANQSEATASPSTGNSDASPAARSAESQREKSKAETASQRVAPRPQTEKSTASSQPSASQNDNGQAVAHDRDRNPDRGRNPIGPTPGPSPLDSSRNMQGRQPGHPPGASEVPSVRTFPNGTKVIIQPDGTRIVTMPNGTTRVFPPSQKPNRRRNRIP